MVKREERRKDDNWIIQALKFLWAKRNRKFTILVLLILWFAGYTIINDFFFKSKVMSCGSTSNVEDIKK